MIIIMCSMQIPLRTLPLSQREFCPVNLVTQIVGVDVAVWGLVARGDFR
jgi:hypothetical protein